MKAEPIKVHSGLIFYCPVDGEKLSTHLTNNLHDDFLCFKGSCRKCGRVYSIIITGPDSTGQSIHFCFKEAKE